MKNVFSFLVMLLLLQFSTSAQDMIRLQSCNDTMIARQADSLKAVYQKEGMVLEKETSIAMESEKEMPVVVPLTQGTSYQFAFIGDNSSRSSEVKMFDWNEKQVVFQQKKWGDANGNIILYEYTPTQSEFHTMKPVQVNKKKKKEICGYVMLFRKAN